MTAPHPVKVWDLDKDAESAPRFVVAVDDYTLALSRLRDAEQALKTIRDSTFRAAVVLRGVADDCLARIGKVPE